MIDDSGMDDAKFAAREALAAGREDPSRDCATRRAKVESLSEWKRKARRPESAPASALVPPTSKMDPDRFTREQKCAEILQFVLADSTTNRQIDALLQAVMDIAQGAGVQVTGTAPIPPGRGKPGPQFDEPGEP